MKEAIMINMVFTEEEVVEIANHTAFTAFHALEDDDDEAWRVAVLAVSILGKLEVAYPALIESERFEGTREMIVLRRRVASRSQT
jgi:hypothetical protein